LVAAGWLAAAITGIVRTATAGIRCHSFLLYHTWLSFARNCNTCVLPSLCGGFVVRRTAGTHQSGLSSRSTTPTCRSTQCTGR
jgi:uncharacterized membrane protein